MFFDIEILVTKIIGKTSIWTIRSVWVFPSDNTNWEFEFLMQQLPVH